MPSPIIAPAILSETPTAFKALVTRYFPFTKRAHIDLSDASLTPVKTIAPASVWWPRGWTTDIHLISRFPSQYLDTIIKLKPHLLIVHAEAEENLLDLFAKLKSAGIKAGVAIIKNVFPDNIKPIILAADYALIFSGELGYYGGKADLLLLEKVPLIRRIKPEIEIGWDGGVNLNCARPIAQAKVDVLNVGSAISNATNPAEVFAKLSQEIEQEEPLL